MAGPGGSEVGRVSVRVVPDTDGFRSDLREDLERETRGLEAEIGVDLDTLGLRQRLQAAVAEASRGVDANVGVDVDQAQLRRVSTALNRSFNRMGQRGGGNLLTRQFTNLIGVIRQIGAETGELFRTIARNFRALRGSAQDLTDTLEISAGAADRIREAFEEYRKAVDRSSESLKDVKEDVDQVAESASNLPVLWRDANRSMEELHRDILGDAAVDSWIGIRPEIDQTALQRFRRDFRRAMDTVRQDINSRAFFEFGPDGLREVTIFERSVRNTVQHVRRIATEINRITQFTARLRYAWNGLVSTVRGIPGWVVRIGRAVFDLRAHWERLNVAAVRTRLIIEDVSRSLLRLPDTFQQGFIRGWLELENVAGGALTRLRQAVDRVQVGIQRLNIAADGVATRVVNAFTRLGRAVEDAAARVYDFRLNTLDLPARWHDVRRAVLLSGDAVQRLVDRIRDVSGLWYDVRRATLIAGDGIAEVTRRVLDFRSHLERARSAVTAFANAIRNLDWNALYRGFIRTGDAAVSFGRRVGNATRGVGQAFQSIGRLGVAAFQGITQGVASAGRALANGFRGALSAIGTGFSALGTIFRGVGTHILTIIGLVAQLAVAIGALGAVATVLVVAGAAISAAWAAVSTAVAAIPSALLLLAGPILTVMAGLDGIKKAAQAIKPEFDKLRAAVANTFEKGLTPVLERLAKNVFPDLQTGAVGIADSLVHVGDQLERAIETDAGMNALRGTMENIAAATRDLSPALNDIVLVMLEMGAMKGGFDALTGSLQVFATAWRDSVAQLAKDNVLQRAFEGLEMVLSSLSIAFVELVENGIKTFAAAAPGISKGLDSITNFFNRFDYERLGTAIGKVFEGLGEALDNVDTATIEDITVGFERMGDTLNDPVYQDMFTNILSAIPTVLSALNSLMQGFLRVGSFAVGLGQVLGGVVDTIVAMFQGLGTTLYGVGQTVVAAMKTISDPVAAFNGDFEQLWKDAQRNITQGFTDLSPTFTKAGEDIRQGLGKMGDALKAGSPLLGEAARQTGVQLGQDLHNSLALVPNAATGALEPLSPQVAALLGEVPPAAEGALAPLPGLLGEITGQLPGVVEEGLSPIPDTAVGIFEQLEVPVRRAFAGLSIVAFEGMGYIRDSVTDGMTEINTALSTGLGTQAKDAVTTAFQAIKESVATEMTNIVTAVRDGVTGITDQITVLTESMTGIETSFTDLGTAFTTLGATFVTFNTNLTTITASFSKVNTGLLTITTSLQAINVILTTINTSFTTLNTTLTTLGTNLVTVNTNITTLNTTLTTLNTTITTLITSLVNLGTAISGLNLSLPLLDTALFNLNNKFVTLNTTLLAFVTTLDNLAAAVDRLVISIEALNVAITNLGIAFTTLNEVVTQTMQTMTEAVATALGQILDSFVTTFELIAAAVTTGMADATAAVEQGTADMVAALDAAVPEFRRAGEEMGQGLVEGLKSKQGAVEAAARDLANAAASALNAAARVNSPSRVTMETGASMGEGLAVGMDKSRRLVRGSAIRLVDEVISASDALSNAFAVDEWTADIAGGVPSAVRSLSGVSGSFSHEVDSGGIGTAVAEALSGWNVQIDGNGMAKMVNKSNTRRNRRG